MAAVSNLFLLFPLFYFIFNEPSVTATRRDANEAVKCYNEMNKDNDITYLLLNVKSPQQIDSFCGKINNWMKCINDYEDGLTTAENTAFLSQTQGIRQFYINVCPPGSDITTTYKAHAPCYELVRHQMRSCGYELPPENSPSMREARTRCCILRDFRRCIKSAVEIRCGEDAGNVTNQIVKRYHKSFMKECENEERFRCESTKDSRNNRPGYGGYSTERYPNKWTNKDESGRRWNENDIYGESPKRRSETSDKDGKEDKKWKDGTSGSLSNEPFIALLYLIISTFFLRVF